MSNTIALYPLSNFTFRQVIDNILTPICLFTIEISTKEAQPEEDPSVSARLQRLQNNYEDFGMRRTVEGILVVHDHGHPHILMLQIANAFFKLWVFSGPSFPFSRHTWLVHQSPDGITFTDGAIELQHPLHRIIFLSCQNHISLFNFYFHHYSFSNVCSSIISTRGLPSITTLGTFPNLSFQLSLRLGLTKFFTTVQVTISNQVKMRSTASNEDWMNDLHHQPQLNSIKLPMASTTIGKLEIA